VKSIDISLWLNLQLFRRHWTTMVQQYRITAILFVIFGIRFIFKKLTIDISFVTMIGDDDGCVIP